MKRITLGIIMIICTAITSYAVFIWKPNGNNISEKNAKVYSEDDIAMETIGESVPVESTSIFKVDKRSINESIKKEEKKVIDNILNKVSTIDLGRIDNLLNKDNKEDGVRESLELLKKRLSNSDYKTIESILEEYIDFDVIGTKI